MTEAYHRQKLLEYALAHTPQMQAEVDESKERIGTVEEAIELLLSGVTE